MKIRILRNPSAAYDCKFREGQTVEAKKDLAERLIQDGIAELDKPIVKGVSDKPKIADAASATTGNQTDK